LAPPKIGYYLWINIWGQYLGFLFGVWSYALIDPPAHGNALDFFVGARDF